MADEEKVESPEKRKPGRPRKPVDTDAAPTFDATDRDGFVPDEILSSAEIDDLRAEVEEEAREEEKAKARKELKAKLKSEARQKKGLEEAQVEVTIDLAPYTDRLLIDNVAYLQGVTYTVRATVAAVMNEQMQRTWTHQAEIDGKSENFYRRTRNPRVIPVGDGVAVVNTSQLLKA